MCRVVCDNNKNEKEEKKPRLFNHVLFWFYDLFGFLWFKLYFFQSSMILEVDPIDFYYAGLAICLWRALMQHKSFECLHKVYMAQIRAYSVNRIKEKSFFLLDTSKGNIVRDIFIWLNISTQILVKCTF